MRQDVAAPWAEPVPGAPFPMTIAQMQELPEDRWQNELVEGGLIRGPWSGFWKSALAAELTAALGTYVHARKLGVVTSANGMYNLTPLGAPTETALIPDAAFVRAGRLPPLQSEAANEIPHLAPDLVVEVAFSHQRRDDLAAKARRYLEAGARLVWVIWPEDEQVDVWRPGSNVPVATLTIADQVDGLDVVPGFSHPVADLFTE